MGRGLFQYKYLWGPIDNFFMSVIVTPTDTSGSAMTTSQHIAKIIQISIPKTIISEYYCNYYNFPGEIISN